MFDDIDREFQAGRRRKDLSTSSEVLLQDIVLDEHPEVAGIDATLGGERFEKRSPDVADRIGGCTHLADPLERNPLHQDFDVGK